tara:strand:- start:1044 stop:1310 length:267 start_codon:yes stop_codon:yes gene_type:complete
MPAIEKFSSKAYNTSLPFVDGAEITPDDNNDLEFVARCFYVGVSGNVTFVTPGGTTLTLTNVPVGIVPWNVARFMATGTTAAGIVAGW